MKTLESVNKNWDSTVCGSKHSKPSTPWVRSTHYVCGRSSNMLENAKAVFDILWHEDHASWYIHIIEANKMAPFLNFILITTLQTLDRLTVHHQECWYCIHSNSRQSTWIAWQIPVAVKTISTLLMMDGKSVRNM